jgi:hypothetical protein
MAHHGSSVVAACFAVLLGLCYLREARAQAILVTESPQWATGTPDVRFDTPADADVAVGLGEVVVVDNWQIVVYSKADFEVDPEDAELARYDLRWENGFWSSHWTSPPADAQVRPLIRE